MPRAGDADNQQPIFVCFKHCLSLSIEREERFEANKTIGRRRWMIFCGGDTCSDLLLRYGNTS